MKPELSIDDDNYHYKFNRTKYHLIVENIFVWFDIVVSECFPVDDFDVNFLTYSYKNNIELIEGESEYFDKDKLIRSIKNKQMTILTDYIRRLISKCSSEVHVSRINKRFLSRGWTIKYKNIYFPNPLTTLWTKKTFGCKLDGSNLIYIKNESSDVYVDFKDKINTNDDNLNNCIIS